MLQYVIQTIGFQLFFLIIYDVFLKKETFFNWNRAYLLVTAVLSILIPFIKIDRFKNMVPKEYIVNLPEIIIGNLNEGNNNAIVLDAVVIESEKFWTWEMLLYGGMLVAAILLVYKIAKVLWLLSKNPKSKLGNFLIVKLLNSSSAFSFFRYIFLGELIKESDRDAILKHELVHVQQKHTLDLLLFEIFRILFWFNPLVYMYQNRMTELHEFIADKEAVKHQNKLAYYENLLSQVFDTQKVSFINPFFKQSLIKKRIVMLSKSKSKQISLMKYALLIPMILGMLVCTSCIQSINAAEKEAKFENTIKEIQETPFIKKIKALREAIAVKGDINDLEEKGLNLLLQITKKDSFNKKLVKKVQKYTALKDKTNVMQKITDIFEQIQIQGNLSEKETKTLKGLLILTSDDGFEDPFFADVISEVEIPFGVIENVPVFPGCEELTSNQEKRECLSENIQRFVSRKFNTDLAGNLGLIGKQRINVIFKIDNEGNVTGIRSRAPHPALEKEAIRVISLLPKMKPGLQRGKAVTVPYSLPIIFMVQDKVKINETELVPLNEMEVPFSVIENVPVFPGCEDLTSNVEKKQCMSKSIQKFVNRNFNTSLADSLGLVGRQRINVIFKIDNEGNVTGIRSRAPHPALEKEAVRVISLLPKMKPGIQRGKAVTVPYSLPIIFQVQDDSALEEVKVVYKGNQANQTEDVVVPFGVIENVPVFPGCEDLTTNQEKKECMSEKIQKFIGKNFNTKLANDLGLSGKQRINVIFKINKEGYITGIRTRAPHPVLETEVMRVISSLPKMKPGMQRGKAVTVPYSLPIVFFVKGKKR